MEQKKVKKNTLYIKFLNFFIKKGKKSASKRLINSVFLYLSKKTSRPLSQLLISTFLKLNLFVEVRRVKAKRRLYTIPFSISVNRRLYLILKWIKMSTLDDKKRRPLYQKIYSELHLLHLNFKNSRSLKYKDTALAQAASNRSNTHFRW